VVPSLKDAALRLAFMRDQLARLGLAEVAAALDDLAGSAEQADPIAREVLGAVMPELTSSDAQTMVSELRAHAAERSLLALGRLLRSRRSAAPATALEPDERLLAKSKAGRVLTLGERKALARRPSRAALERVMRDAHPAVVRFLLQNPCLTEDDVVRLAARRPASVDVLAQIAGSPEWLARPRVRMAIVQNPRAPTELAVPIVGLLIRPELEQVVEAADVAAVVRAAASDKLARLPPLRTRGDDSGQPH
jgi:hypothetical protein